MSLNSWNYFELIMSDKYYWIGFLVQFNLYLHHFLHLSFDSRMQNIVLEITNVWDKRFIPRFHYLNMASLLTVSLSCHFILCHKARVLSNLQCNGCPQATGRNLIQHNCMNMCAWLWRANARNRRVTLPLMSDEEFIMLQYQLTVPFWLHRRPHLTL